MGKVVKTVLKVAAVAAISFFAPPLAASIGSSIGVTSALGTTALAAGIGAGAGELAGVGWKTGLMVGGLAGAGNTGLFGGKAPTVGTGTPAPPAADTAFLEQATGGPLGPPGAGAAGVGGVAGAAPAAAAAGAPTTLGGALSAAGSNPLSVATGGLKNVTSGLGGALGAVGLGGAAAGGGALSNVAPVLLAAGLAGNPGGTIAKAQEAELKRAQQVNAALTQQRLDQANQLIGEAAYYDPEYMARQAAEAAMTRGAVQATEQTRGLTGERLAAERRRMALGTSRTAGSAYQQGYGTGVGARLQTRQAGIQAIPNEYPMTSSASAIASAEAARQARAEEVKKLGDIFDTVLYGNAATQRGA